MANLKISDLNEALSGTIANLPLYCSHQRILNAVEASCETNDCDAGQQPKTRVASTAPPRRSGVRPYRKSDIMTEFDRRPIRGDDDTKGHMRYSADAHSAEGDDTKAIAFTCKRPYRLAAAAASCVRPCRSAFSQVVRRLGEG